MYPRNVLVAIRGPDQHPLGSLGSLNSVSPEELPAAFLARVVDAIQLGASHEELEAWRSVLLTVTFHFEVLPSEQLMHNKAMHQREHIVVDFSAMARTTRQWVYTIVSIKSDLEMTGKKKDSEVADWVNSNVGIAVKTGKITARFVTSACDIHSKIFVHPELAEIVDGCEEEWGMHSPINQMSKMRLVAKQCKSLARLVLGNDYHY